MRVFVLGLVFIFCICVAGVKANIFLNDFFGDCGDPGIECTSEYIMKAQSPDLHFIIGETYTIEQIEKKMGSKTFLHVYSNRYKELMIIGMDPKDTGKIVILKETDLLEFPI